MTTGPAGLSLIGATSTNPSRLESATSSSATNLSRLGTFFVSHAKRGSESTQPASPKRGIRPCQNVLSATCKSMRLA
eukprot:1415341-Rhodomonas_salina.1